MNAPFTWPKSSLSISSPGIEAQFTATNGPGRPECSWIERATSSLPVPVSPSMSTVAAVGATRATSSRISSIAGAPPMRRAPAGPGRVPPPGTKFPPPAWRRAMQRSKADSICSVRNGFDRKSAAPARNAATAVSRSARAAVTTTSVRTPSSRNAATHSRPERPGSRTSTTSRSKW